MQQYMICSQVSFFAVPTSCVCAHPDITLPDNSVLLNALWRAYMSI